MSEYPENKKLSLSTIENILIATIEERTDSIRLSLETEEVNDSKVADFTYLIKLSNYLEESYRLFLSKLDAENLRTEHDKFSDVIKKADCKLAIMISDRMKASVNDKYILTDELLQGWKYSLDVLKQQMIPRLIEEGLDNNVGLLEGAIMQSEIKIAYDLDEGKSEEKRE